MSDTPEQPPTAWTAPTPPPEASQTSPAGAPPVSPTRRRPVALLAVVVVLVAAVIALGVLYAGERSTSADLRDQIADRKQADQEAADAVVDLEAIAGQVEADDAAIDWSGGPDSLTVEAPYPVPRALAWIEEFMDDAGMPGEAIIARMGQTRALDGTQEADGAGVTVTWTYHPDDGLSAVFSVDG